MKKEEKKTILYWVVYRYRWEIERLIFKSDENRITPLLVSEIYTKLQVDMVEKEWHSELFEILKIRNLWEID